MTEKAKEAATTPAKPLPKGIKEIKDGQGRPVFQCTNGCTRAYHRRENLERYQAGCQRCRQAKP